MKENTSKNTREKYLNPSVIIILFFILVSLVLSQYFYLITDNKAEKILCETTAQDVCTAVTQDYENIRKDNRWVASLAKQVVITDEDVLVRSGKYSKEEVGDPQYEGLTDQTVNVIYIYAPAYSGSDTLKHEFYHLVDYNLGNSSRTLYLSQNVEEKLGKIQEYGKGSFSKSDRFKSLMRKHLKIYASMFSESDYDISSYQEAFVSLMMTYDEDGRELKEKIPSGYEYAKEVHDILNEVNNSATSSRA